MKYTFSILILLCLPLFLTGQTSDKIDIIYLKNGSIFKGKLLEENKEEVQFQLRENKSMLVLNPKEIRSIKRENSLNYSNSHLDKVIKIKEYAFKEKGFYQSLSLSLMTEIKENEEDIVKKGFGFNFVYGYRFHRALGLGLGLGMDQYDLKDNKKIVPVFINLQGFLNAKKISPMYNIDVGYGLGLDDAEFLEKNTPGILFHPSLGLRFNGSAFTNVTLDVGMRFQKITDLFYINDFQGIYFQEESIKYNRLTIRLGILF